MSLIDLGPYRLPAEDAAYEAALRDALVKELYDRGLGTGLALIPVLLILKAILNSAWDDAPGVKILYVALAMVLVLRLVLLYWHRGGSGRATSRQLGWAFLLGAALMSIGFAAINWFAWPFLSPGQIGLLVILHVGISSVALTSMAPSVWAFLVYIGVNVSSLLFLAWQRGGVPEYNHLLILLIVLYLCALPAMCIKNHRTMADQFLTGLKLKDMALQDTLTGLRNRRFLLEFMGLESERILRSWSPDSAIHQNLTILMLDLDHFKQVNDTLGHSAGDEVLRQVASILVDTVRKHDLVIRWGGEEFVIVARGSDRSYALVLAERIRAKIESHAFALADGKSLSKTCSIGFSLYPFAPERPDQTDWEQVLGLADAALYRAKASGRNRALGVFPGARTIEEGQPLLDRVKHNLSEAVEAGVVRILGGSA